jgi:hypothetical protein
MGRDGSYQLNDIKNPAGVAALAPTKINFFRATMKTRLFIAGLALPPLRQISQLTLETDNVPK